ILNEVAVRMKQHLLESNRELLWKLFETRVLTPTLQQIEPPPYEQMVRELGFSTATEACSAVVTAKRMFARLLREVIGAYALDDEAIEEELNDLRQILS